MPEYLNTILLLISVILLLIIMFKQFSSKGLNSGKEINELKEQMNTEFERSRRENASVQSDTRNEISSRLNEMSGKIEQIRAETTDRQNRFENGINNAFHKMKTDSMTQSEKQNNIIYESLEKIRNENEKKLEEMRVTVDEKLTATLSTRIDSSFKSVSDRLENVYTSLGEMKELSSGVTNNVSALNRVLSNVKARGTWAEVQLGSILDQTIPGMYETNFASIVGSDDRVEFAVKIPANDGSTTYLPIDSKFPMEDYIRLCEAADNGDNDLLDKSRKQLEARVLSEAKTVSKYINVPITTPYAILYLATEGLYAEILSSKSGLSEKIRADYNIMIAGPSTITALLNSLSLGFRAVAINEKANEVRLLLSAAKQQYDKFGNLIQKARKKIDEAGASLDEADKRNNIIRKKLGKVEELDASTSASILEIEESNYTYEEDQ